MTVDSHQQTAEKRGEREGDEGNAEGGDGAPEKEGVPLPEPEVTDEGDGVFAGDVEEFGRGEGQAAGVKDMGGDVDERDDEQKLQRIDDVVSYLGGRDVEPEDEGCGEAEECGAAEDGIDADEESGCEAPGEFLRGRSHAEEGEDGQDGAAVDPIMVDGRGTLRCCIGT
jgi:hypothetical protein